MVANRDLIITANMGNGTIQAKLEPLSRINSIGNIYFLRKKIGPTIPKVKYILLPSLCKISFFNIILTPLLLTHYTIKCRACFIVSYHIIPYAFFAAIASFVTGRPYFVCQTGSLIQCLAEKKLLWVFLKKVILKSKKLCVPGTTTFDYWKAKGIPVSKMCIIHSTIDTHKFSPEPFNGRLYDFVYIGSITPEKRIDFLLKAFASVCCRHPKTKLLLVGDGPLLESMKELSSLLNLNKNVFFAGFHQNVLPWLNKAKFIVLVSNSEGLPCAIMEGMSVGLIPITTRVGNLPDIVINGKTGFCFEKDDIENLIRHMDHLLLSKPREIEPMRQNARRIIIEQHSHNFSIEKWKVLLGM